LRQFNWSVTGGTSLPAGLRLNNSTGAITGTPTVSGVFAVTFQSTDSSSPQQTAWTTLGLTIAGLSIATTNLLNPMVGEPYNQTLQYANTLGTLPVTWSLASWTLPTGFSLNASTRAITGTAMPSEVVTSNFTLQLVDASTPTPQTTTQPLILSITSSPGNGVKSS